MPHAISYLPQEIRSYLPTGWELADEPPQLDVKRGVWKVRVLDGADNDWEVAVTSKTADKMGRLPALRSAMDRVYREALG